MCEHRAVLLNLSALRSSVVKLCFRVMTPCSLIGLYWHFEGTHRLCLYSKAAQSVASCFSTRNHHYFKSFLLQRFVLTIHSRLCQPQHPLCSTCISFKLFGLSLISEISRFAHSGFGEGELAHHLLKGEKSVQRLLAVCIPYIVRLVAMLWHFYTLMDTKYNSIEAFSGDQLCQYGVSVWYSSRYRGTNSGRAELALCVNTRCKHNTYHLNPWWWKEI